MKVLPLTMALALTALACSDSDENCRQRVIGGSVVKVCDEPDAGRKDGGSTACGSDTDCSPLLPYCSAGHCVVCRDDNDCAPETPFCQGGAMCAQCLSDQDCTDGLHCSNLGNCSACDLSCSDPLFSFCTFVNGSPTCVECLESAHCTSLVKPVCDVTENKCYACTQNTDCPNDRECIEHICLTSEPPPCTRDSDCSAPFPVCVGGACSECRGSGDCPGAKVCIFEEFFQIYLCGICTSDVDCPGSHPKCRSDGVCCSEGGTSGECIACRDDGDCASTEVCQERRGVMACWPQ